jgi:hypothetical protein
LVVRNLPMGSKIWQNAYNTYSGWEKPPVKK